MIQNLTARRADSSQLANANKSVSASGGSTASQVVYDAGESLKRAVQSVITNDTNGHINATTAQLESTLRQNGIKDTRFVGQLLYSLRGVQQGVPGDLQKFKQAVQMARTAGALGPRGATALLGMVNEVAQRQTQKAAVDNSILNVKNQPAQRKPFESVFESVLPKPPRSIGADLFENAPQRRPQAPAPAPAQAQQPKPAKQPEALSPAVNRAITSIDVASKSLPGGLLKESLAAVHAAVKLVTDAQTMGDKETHQRAIIDLTSKTFKLIGEIAKTMGQHPELAEKAAGQLGNIAKVLGDQIAKPLKVLEYASRAFGGQTLDGTPVDNKKRVDALYELLGMPLPPVVQGAMLIAKEQIQAIYTYLGVPAQRSIETIGLKGLFNGKSAEQLKADIRALPTADAASANGTVRKLVHFFPNTGAYGSSNATANDLWRKSMATEMKPFADDLRAMVTLSKDSRGLLDERRTQVAERMKEAAVRFIDEQLTDARGNW
ncbi:MULTISPECIES: hypothetical protein [unclassified Corallococcus]|uniref:hypothetical protein n=1 Tax=unclassified Corallococcus TaxID=2685029 RepID=UPI001A8DCFF0|nr:MULTISPECIES: hypothetical protein [unclassified Corallococcus]MBN9684328.1 hypothetical protein [Corallococcus sp. NCSPR001]WAS84192.1 hypothetical protein O0N60_33495 [Corallococcus sp. NCRR]